MLVKISIENFKSFDQKEELSMISSSKIRGNKNHRVKIKQTQLLTNAVVYGANASGKSNLVAAFAFIKRTLLEGLPIGSANDFCRNKEANKTRESVFELQFTVGDTFYAYGFSAILSQEKITGEWLYELLQDGGARRLFEREEGKTPILGDAAKITDSEKIRFTVYSEDFAGQENRLFLSEMNRGKRFDTDSNMSFFREVFSWIVNNIVVVNPNSRISSAGAYYNSKSLENISALIRIFDTGVTDVKTKRISIEEMKKTVPPEDFKGVFAQLNALRQTSIPNLPLTQQSTWRINGDFFNISVKPNSEPEISTLVLKHGSSAFDFNMSDESDGTKRLFDLIDMILGDRPDTVFIVDELDRSLHPKLTEQFLKQFMEAHDGARAQLVFTTHEDRIMDQNLFRRDEIWFIEKNAEEASKIYSLDRFKERYDKKLSKSYLEGRYGAIPVFPLLGFKGA